MTNTPEPGARVSSQDTELCTIRHFQIIGSRGIQSSHGIEQTLEGKKKYNVFAVLKR